jgi:hypothetical protein
MVNQKKIQIEKMPSKNGRTFKFYIKPEQEDYLGELVSKLDKSPSEILRTIIDTHKEVSFLFDKLEVQQKS